MSVLTDLKNRGVKDVFFVVCDGLKGLPEVVGNVWPQAIVQTCIIHLIRNTFRLTSRKYWDEIKRDVQTDLHRGQRHRGPGSALDELTEKWGQRYPAVIRLWDNAWDEFIPFLDYDVEIRRSSARPTLSSPSTPATGGRSRPAGTSPPSRPR